VPERIAAVRDHLLMVLLCYDGSDDAKAAIDPAGTAVSEARAQQRRERHAQA
jgi:hypothetical protein